MALRSERTSKGPGGGTGPYPDQEPLTAPAGIAVDSALPATGGWLLRGQDGRLTAYVPTAGEVLRWTERTPGGPDWTGPERLAAPGLLTHLSVARSGEGYVHLVGVRKRPRPDVPPATDVVHAVQFQTGRPLRDWHTLGNPHTKDRRLAASIGLPSAVVDNAGALHVVVRNGNGALSTRNQAPTGRWGPWGVAGDAGTVLTGEPAAAVTDSGLIEVLAPAGNGLVHWLRKTPEGPLEPTGEGPAAQAESGTLGAERTGGGRLTHFWRDTGDATVRAWRPSGDPVPLGGPGTGPLALLRTPVDGYDCTVLAQRGVDGRPRIAAFPTEDESAGLHWTPTGEPCVGAPALALDAHGRVVLAAVGTDGRLRVARQKAEPGLALAAWTRV